MPRTTMTTSAGAADMVRRIKESYHPYEEDSVHMVEGENRKRKEQGRT